jgi:hypothetical protein
MLFSPHHSYSQPILKDFLFNPSILTRDAVTELAVQSKYAKMQPSETVATAESFFVNRNTTRTVEQTSLLSSHQHALPEDSSSKSLRSNDGSEDDGYIRRRNDSGLLSERGMGTQPIQIGHAATTSSEVDALAKQIDSLRLELQHAKRNNELYLQRKWVLYRYIE